jgi:hypothetical protein
MIPDRVPPEYDLSDEAAAYIAEALMALALFESTHFAQIRCHYQCITPPKMTTGRERPMIVYGSPCPRFSASPPWCQSVSIGIEGSLAHSPIEPS